MKRNAIRLGSLLMAACLLDVKASSQAPASAPVTVEESDVAVLPEASPQWVFINTNWGRVGTRIFDGATGKMVGQIAESEMANFAADPAGRYFYIAETMWSKGNRGTRQDMLTVYDAKTLKIVREIALPGRLLVGNRKHNLGISADGRYAFVYNMDPASSIVIVDLQRARVSSVKEVPGCGLSAAVGGRRSLSLCSDGALALIALNDKGAASLTRSSSFFSAENDPIFDNFSVDPARSRVEMVSYSGMVHSADLSSGIKLDQAWSLQEAAGLPRGSTEPLVANWYPGGRQPSAFNRASGQMFVLMHMGEYWSQKEPGTELWVVDTNSKKVLKRVKLEKAASWIEVSQDPQPLLFIAEEGHLLILDAATLEKKHEIEGVGNGPMSTVSKSL